MRAAWTRRAMLAAIVVVGGCARCRGGGAASDASPVASASGSIDGGAPRCEAIGSAQIWGGAIVDASEGALVPFAAEIGGGASDDRGFLVGARAAGSSGAATILRIDADSSAVREMAKLPAKGEARAPLVAVDGTHVVVGTLIVEGGARTFRIDALDTNDANDANEPLSPLGAISQALDESEATSILAFGDAALVAWDDADPTGVFGRVRLVRVDRSTPPPAPSSSASAAKPASSAQPPPPDVVSPPSSDASWPLLVRSPDAKRAVLLWLAERPEQDDDPDAVPGEPTQAAAFRWVEAVVVDPTTARPLGPVCALTSHDGHAQTMAAIWIDRGLFVAVRDDARPTDADGGSLLSLHSTLDASSGAISEPTASIVASEDLAAGAPSIVMLADGPYAAILDVHDEARFLPLDRGVASTESWLEGREVVTSRGDRVLAARPNGAGVELSIVRCR